MISLHHLPKKGGARLHNAHTFRASCDAADKSKATAWLEATETLKAPDEAAYDEFVHVMLGLMDAKTPVVIKLQEVNHLSEREATVAALFRSHDVPNVAVPICEFKCHHNILHWQTPIKMKMPFCDGGDTLLSVFVMEWIPHNLIDYLAKNPVSDEVFLAIIKQLGYILVTLHYTYGLSHGDIGSGNLMLDVGEPKRIVYKFGKVTRTVDTLGYEPILIDFQRSVQYKERPDPASISDEITSTYHTISRWTGHPINLTPFFEAETIGQIIKAIDALK